jgi:hypothetical protein
MASPWKQKASSSQSQDRELVPQGTHPSACVALVDIGTQTRNYQGTDTTKRMIFVVWELVEEASKPVIGKDFTLSLHEKSLLRDFVRKWRGKDMAEGEEFDISVLLGKTCNLIVTHKKSGDRDFAKVEGVSGLLKSQKVGAPSREPFLWSVDDGDIADLPDWLPYLYGKSIPDWVEESHERKGESGGSGEGEGDAAEGREAASGVAPAGGPTPF